MQQRPLSRLDSLANHGILPRNGKGITLVSLTAALKRSSSLLSSHPIPLIPSTGGLNVGADFATTIGTAGLSTAPTLNLGLSFNLNNLNKYILVSLPQPR